MKGPVNDSLKKLSLVSKYYGTQKPDDEHEAQYLAYVERRRVVSNIQRTFNFSIFLIAYIIVVLSTPIVRQYLSPVLMVAEGAGVIGIIAFAFAARKIYTIIADDTKPYDKKNFQFTQVLFTIFWFVYFLITTFPIFAFPDNWMLVMVVWMPLMILGFMVPVYNLVEGVPTMLCAAASAGLLIYRGLTLGALTTGEVVSAIPAIILAIFITDVNHVERLNGFFLNGKALAETTASQRRLGNVFEEVFDIAFEINLVTGECVMLRDNEHYGMTATDKRDMSIDDLYRYAYQLVHPDDANMFSRVFNIEHVENEFMTLGGSQIYSEARILSAEDEYEWVSILMTKQEPTVDDGNIYALCLVQNIQERKNNEDRLKLEAEKDPLTQLYNKMTTKSLIEECLEKDSSVQHALLIIDIDNFKTINDTRGHTVGDQILLAFSNELNRNFRETDILGRAGGDEFVVLIKNVQSVAMVCDKLQQLTSSFKRYGIDNGFPGRLSTSIGVAMFNKDGKTYEELFKKADAALYEAKRNGKDQYKFSISRSE